MNLEEFLRNISEEDLKKINEEYYNRKDKIPVYSFSKIRDIELETLVDIKKLINKDKFKQWFNNDISIDKDTDNFLENLILENEDLIYDYNEEDLKVYFIIPLLNRVNFKIKEKNLRGFYENKITYKTDKFIFSGTCDFMVSKGLLKSERPYFFLQEFKRAEDFSNPRPQLLAELISAIELNNEITIKGTYIIGENWYFVILEKIGDNKYQYFVSRSYNCCNINDLKEIYKNLLFIKNEIIDKKL